MKFIRSGELYRLISNATKTVWNKLPSRSIKFADTLCFAIGGDSVGMAVADISLEKTYAFTVLNQTCFLGSFTKHLEKHMMDYKFGHFVIGYAIPDSDEKPPEHIEKLLSVMDKAPALKHILYTEFDERGTSKRGAKRRSEIKRETEEVEEGETGTEEGEEVFLDPKERNNTEYKMDIFATLYKKLSGKDVLLVRKTYSDMPPF
ncbi:hypothetical protein Q3G72_013951 [Acer saccharum]|nr:hypothetical protein Q3G72_013951 [Acer saccharum]